MDEYIKKEDAFDVACAECEAGTFYDIPSKIRGIPSADVVTRDCYDRILWENDTMRQQLADIGKAFAEKMDDVVERRHGKWIGIPHKTVSKRNRTIHSMVYICPLCRYSNGRHKSNFCPNCGADMREESEDIPMEYFESGGI